MSINSKSGQFIIEVLVAIGIGAIVLVALMAAVGKALKNTNAAIDVSQASAYAKEAIEIARKTRDQSAGWTAFRSQYNGQNLRLNKDQANLVVGQSCPATPNIDNVFIRCVNFANVVPSNVNKLQVVATVSWTSNRCLTGAYCHNVTATSFLTNWGN